jgi:hypothetical protein
MNPGLLLLIALCMPVLLALTLLLPVYAAIYGAAYLVYANGAADPLSGKWADILYILDVYGQLFSHWRAHIGAVSFVHYTLPVVGLPLLGAVVALWVTWKIAHHVRMLLHLTSSL